MGGVPPESLNRSGGGGGRRQRQGDRETGTDGSGEHRTPSRSAGGQRCITCSVMEMRANAMCFRLRCVPPRARQTKTPAAAICASWRVGDGGQRPHCGKDRCLCTGDGKTRMWWWYVCLGISRSVSVPAAFGFMYCSLFIQTQYWLKQY